eukprot:2208004-Rhodomonas_salina.2
MLALSPSCVFLDPAIFCAKERETESERARAREVFDLRELRRACSNSRPPLSALHAAPPGSGRTNVMTAHAMMR